ncbi:carbon-nitrogen hydrolase family protein [Paenibacillus sp. GP183]|jgi:nitrilase|uniref:carbon-nitrogen hydrolase family protein n=1 Tax=Paenibacillus sp. GP183 TaxID=1882751 RepID=UPI00089D5731|nr:carbon-nitrogen hydrolase family protein [Paenibacillus sp. GP183]SEB87342.1 nitrilase [Paenibacillus sp. GP183]
MKENNVRVAVVQSSPILFNKASALTKIESWTKDAAAQEAKLIVFPEVFLSGYPRGMFLGTRVGSRNSNGRKDWERYLESSIFIPGSDTDILGAIAKESGVYLVIGVVERDSEFSKSTLYNSIVYFGPDGSLLGKHRKLMPTGAERLLWGQGDGSTLTVIVTPFGKIGGLICWENYMPLARAAMYAKGIDILITPTADARDTWQATLQHIACEGRCFVVSGNQFVTKDTYPKDLACYEEISQEPDILSRGGSAVVGPLGEYIAGPLYDREGLIVADLNMSLVTQSRYDFDVVGHYSRPDVFQLHVNEKKQGIVRFL